MQHGNEGLINTTTSTIQRIVYCCRLLLHGILEN